MAFWSSLLRPGPGRMCSPGFVRRAFNSSSHTSHFSSSSFFSSSSATFPSPASPSFLFPRISGRLLTLKYALPSSRFASTAQAAPKRFPERLLIYHAGTPRTTFLACLKVTTLFGLAFFAFLVAPAYVAASKPPWQVLGVAACGIVPFAIVAYTSSPFVVFIHLRLPAYARHPDRDLLRRFVRNIPTGTRLDVTTMNLVGRPRLTSVSVSDLVPAHEQLRIVNFVNSQSSSPPALPTNGIPAVNAAAKRPAAQPSKFITTSSKFPWIHLPPTTRFGAPSAGNSRGVRDGWAWDELLALIERRAQQPKKTTS